MAMPIAPTPFLMGRDAERFDRVVSEGLIHRNMHNHKPVDMQWLGRAISSIEERKRKTGV